MKPITVLVCALGGEGGGVLAEWLYGAAVRAGLPAQSTSIPGVAQRTGATTYYLEVGPVPEAVLGPRRPVFGLQPVAGEIDLLVSSELLETARQVANGMASAERSTVLSATTRALTVAEKMQLTDGRVDAAALVRTLQRHARHCELLDFDALAKQAGTVVSAPMLGAIAASGVLPIPREVFEAQIGAGGKGASSAKGIAASLRGFALAYDLVAARRQVLRAVAEAVPAPPAAPDLRALARDKLRAYQDEAYVRRYDERLARVEAAAGAGSETAAEVTRWLALWMAFDDIVHVAGLKLAASRQARVRREVKARDDEIVKLFDHFKPGVPEFAALLPPAAAQRLLAWDRRRVAAGRQPWALPLKVGTHTVSGALMLRALAALKAWRPRGSRWATEQALIERWLAAVECGAREHAALGLELAKCGRLVKGYGSTNERGKENLLHIVDHLAAGAAPVAARAEAVRAAREAALADDAGRALDRTLVAHGAPPRPPREQVVRWYKRKPEATARTPA
jgi:indolepyruvate ferredoxin oxidoreductase, beta subunit